MAIITEESILRFSEWLQREEKSEGTVENYTRNAGRLMRWLDGRELTVETAAEWKAQLSAGGYNPATVNSMLAMVNAYSRFAKLGFSVRFLRLQKKLYREESRELTQREYELLIDTAEKAGNGRLALLMETIAATGIRVSEVKYITVEAAERRKARIALKGKIREIMLPGKLCRKLLKYARRMGLVSGEIFLSRSGRGMSRKQIWAAMKEICRQAGIEESKVFPHNLRHLFARVYYRIYKDVAKLADLLGHSCIETTRIYLMTTGEEHARQLERLGIVR